VGISFVKPILPSLALAVGLLAAGGSVAQPRPPAVTYTPGGDWQVGLMSAPGTPFQGCVAQVRTDNSATVILQRRANGETALVINQPNGPFAPDQQVAVTGDVDGRLQRQLRAVVPQPGVLIVGNFDNEFLTAMGRGNRMSLDLGGRTVSLALRGTGRAVADLRSCVETQGRGSAPPQQAQAAPPAQSPPPAAAPAAPAGQAGQAAPAQAQQRQRPPVAATREVTILPPPLIDLLIQAGMQNAQPLILDEVPPERRPGNHNWRLGPIIGSVLEVQIPPDMGFEDASVRVVDGLRTGCTADFNARQNDAETIGAIVLRTAQVRCITPEGPIHAALFTYLTPDRVLLRFMHFGPVGEAVAADRWRDAILGVVRRTALAEAQQPVPAPPPPAAAPAPAPAPSR
jgi:hypothetical protein